MKPSYTYRAELIRVIDADTLVLRIDAGFYISVEETIRVMGVDAPELRTEAGKAARQAVVGWVVGKAITVQTFKGTQSFARWVGHVWANDQLLADYLTTSGYITQEHIMAHVEPMGINQPTPTQPSPAPAPSPAPTPAPAPTPVPKT